MKEFVDSCVYCLCGKDEITQFLMSKELDHGDMVIEVPWPDDYINMDDEELNYVFDVDKWGVSFETANLLKDNISVQNRTNDRIRRKTLQRGTKIIIETIIKHYAPLILAKKAFILKRIVKVFESESQFSSQSDRNRLHLGDHVAMI
jgi:hypothetical protein